MKLKVILLIIVFFFPSFIYPISSYKGKKIDNIQLMKPSQNGEIPSNFTLNHTANTPDEDGSFDIYWESSENADNYSIFVSNSNITNIDKSSVLTLETGYQNLSYHYFALNEGDYYFKIYAYNQFGNRSSNCIRVSVRFSAENGEDYKEPETRYWWWILIVIGVGIAIGVGFYLYMKENRELRSKEYKIEF
jgi:hypothetical protein